MTAMHCVVLIVLTFTTLQTYKIPMAILPLGGTLNTLGWERLRFSTEIALYPEKVRDRSVVTTDH